MSPQIQAAYNAIVKQVGKKGRKKFDYYFNAWQKYFAGRDDKDIDDEILTNSLTHAVASYNGTYGAPAGWQSFEKVKQPMPDVAKYGIGAGVGTVVGIVIGKKI